MSDDELGVTSVITSYIFSLPVKVVVAAIAGVGVVGAIAEFFSPTGDVNVITAKTKPQLNDLISKAPENQLVVVNYGSLQYEPCVDMKPYYDQFSRIYPDVLFIFCDISTANITDIAHAPTFKLFRNDTLLETLNIGNDASKLQKNIDKHLGN